MSFKPKSDSPTPSADELRVQLAYAPDTNRTAWAKTWLSWGEAAEEPYRRRAYQKLVAAGIDAGLEDRSEPAQTATTAAKAVASFLPDEKRPKSDPCKPAKGVWERAAKGVI